MNNQLRVHPIEILLVEDNVADADLAFEALSESKIRNTLHVVEDGEEAMDFLFKKGKFVDAPTPDLILLDLNLPRKDGREVLRDVKNDPELKRIPIVVLTTSDAEVDIVKSYTLHANSYIKKPLDFRQFVNVVKSIENFWLSIVTLPPQDK